MQACTLLLQSMPPFASLLTQVGPVEKQQPRCFGNPVVASEMQFRMSILGPCVSNLPEVRRPALFGHPHLVHSRPQTLYIFCA